jgi:hypothetical protein
MDYNRPNNTMSKNYKMVAVIQMFGSVQMKNTNLKHFMRLVQEGQV